MVIRRRLLDGNVVALGAGVVVRVERRVGGELHPHPLVGFIRRPGVNVIIKLFTVVINKRS